LTGFAAFGSSFDSSTGLEGSIHVVVTGCQGIWFAPVISDIIQISSDKSRFSPIVPSFIGISSFAPISTAFAAGSQILGRDSGLESLVGSNTDSVRHGFNSAKGPA